MRLLIAAILLASSWAQARTLSSVEEKINPSSIDQVIRLVDKDSPGSSNLKVSVVVTDYGMSTDVSPRHAIYLTLASLAEMGNIFAEFRITEEAYKFISAQRIAAGIYEVKAQVYDETFKEVTYTIDATKMFSDERKLRSNCGSAFCDGFLTTTVDVKEVAK
ncbi:hypothetical protein AZI85_10385 [Bdellovibrio bacteriovorus]|uniref:Uncharacterized protein n=1 Tax=Bdellovibrio bacteriovorus TaxID=959 RepID=A0A150WDB7_BDEBC|nr:hypothetical protein [Bdellovibrio bacteriovorus]KYG60862.1 hypothetical protein AZI85_10385 [Bdellovibrio bacteriovorus]